MKSKSDSISDSVFVSTSLRSSMIVEVELSNSISSSMLWINIEEDSTIIEVWEVEDTESDIESFYDINEDSIVIDLTNLNKS